MNSTESETQEPPDYVERMQLSVDLLDCSRRLHNARMALARVDAAMRAFPMALEWRRAYALAFENYRAVSVDYDALLDRIRWLEWGMIEEAGP